MTENIIEVTNLKTEFHTKKGIVKAVDGVSFLIKKGEVLGVVGESGCGKSVTSMSILRLVEHSSGKIKEGSIVFKGEDLVEKSQREMRKIRGNEIGMIFQNALSALNPAYTIGNQMIEMLRTNKDISKAKAIEVSIDMLNKVGIPSPEQRMKEYPHQLSGGMSQRVVIGMALLCNPSLLIADEPTTALDVTIQAQILELIKEGNRDLGTSVMIITHDMGVVAEVADEIMVMYAGKDMEKSDTESIFRNPLHPYTKGLLESIPAFNSESTKGVLPTIKGNVPDLRSIPEGCRFASRCKFVMDKCTEVEPDLFQVDNSQVRCWLYEEKEGDNNG